MFKVIADGLPTVSRTGDASFTSVEFEGGEIVFIHLDGAEGYVFGLPNFALGVLCRLHGEQLFSGVFVPFYNHLFFAEGAKMLKRNNTSVKVNQVSGLADSYIGLAFRGTYDDTNAHWLNTFFSVMRTPVRTMIPGSDLYGLSLVANGNLTAMIIAAPKVNMLLPGLNVVIAAGGKVSDHRGQPITEGCGVVIASNGAAHAELLQLFSFEND